MRKIALLLTLLVVVLVCLLPAPPAQAAGAPRTFVSAAGSDSNSCTNVATPCRHLAAAYAATAANGEIYVLDPANYGSLTITGPVSIEGHGWASIAPVSGQAAITINALGATDKINIIGVVLDGTNLATTTGIAFNSGGSLNVEDSVIRNFTGDGISFAPNSSTLSQLYVSNTLISDNGVGISIDPTGTGTTTGVLDHVKIKNNGGNGLSVLTATQTIKVTVTDSMSAGNTMDGIFAQANSGPPVTIMVRNSTIANNGTNGLVADKVNAAIFVTRSTITGNIDAGWVDSSGGSVVSYADNNIDLNGSANSEPPGPQTYH